MKTMKWMLFSLALVAVCALASCEKSNENETQSSLAPQETTTETLGIETSDPDEEYVEPQTAASLTDPHTDSFDYTALSLPDYSAENPVRYMDEDAMLGKYNGWQYFGNHGEIKTIPQPMRSTYTYQMYSYYIRNDVAALYASAGVPLPDTALWLNPGWLTDTTSNGSRLLWYSMGTLPDKVTLENTDTLQNNAQTQPIFYAHYKVTEGDITRDWLLYFIKADGTDQVAGNHAAVFAVQVNEQLDVVKNIADSIARSYEFLHNDFLYYQYAADLNYYSCMYVTKKKVYLWNTSTKPNVDAPEQSEGFDTAYSQSTDANTYFYEILPTAVKYGFETIDAEEANYPYFADRYPASAVAPLHGIAMYRDGKLTQLIANTDIGLSGDVTGFLRLRTKLLSLRNLVESSKKESETSKTQRVTAVLYSVYGAYAPYNTARYYENGTLTEWHYNAPVSEAIDFTSPLNSAEMIDKTEYTIGELPTFAGLDSLPMYFSTPAQYAMTDVGSFIAVFYLEDGSVRITSSSNFNEVSPIWNAARVELDALYQAKVAK